MDHYKRRREQEDAREDRLTILPYDLLISILCFLPVKQCVALSAVCSCFRRLLPSIPRLDTFRLDVVIPSDGSHIHQELTFPRALIYQCRVVFHYEDGGTYWAYLPKSLDQLLVDNLAKAGVQDLILEASAGKEWLDFRGRDCGLFGIKSLRSLSLDRIHVSRDIDRRPLSPLGCALLTSLKMERCFLCEDFLPNLFASCPFLETLQLISCCWFNRSFRQTLDRLCIHSASIKHLVLLKTIACVDTHIHCPKFESLVVEVFKQQRIEVPKVRNASFLLSHRLPVDPPVALMDLLGAPFLWGTTWLMLNSSKTQNILATENGVHKFISQEHKKDSVIVNLDFNLKDRLSTKILIEFLKNCNGCNTMFDILTDSTHIESNTEDDHLLHDSTEVELIDLQMKMPEKTFERFLFNQKEMTEVLKEIGLQMLRSRTNIEQFKNILASEECLFQLSSSIANCIEMKF